MFFLLKQPEGCVGVCLTDSSWQDEPQQGNKRQSKQSRAVGYMSWADCVLLLKSMDQSSI